MRAALPTRLLYSAILAIAVVTVPLVCRAQSRGDSAAMPMNMAPMDTPDRRAAAAAHEAMSGRMQDEPHLHMTALAPPNAADSARAAALVVTMRQTLAKYKDVRVAEAEGFRQFLPGVKQPVYHFTSWINALQERWRFDPAKPTSLLYRQQPDGRFELVGAMYADSPRASEAELNARIPLSIARWHEHVNWCVPPRGGGGGGGGATNRWREMRDGKPVFGPKSPIADATACAAVGGRFLPRIFGWMVHVNAFASDDPTVIWSAEHHEHGP